jgi:hypothetical protein
MRVKPIAYSNPSAKATGPNHDLTAARAVGILRSQMRCDAKFSTGCRPLRERAREAMRLRHLRPRIQEAVRAQHRADLDKGAGWVELPHALDRKLPGEGRLCLLQWVFPATGTYVHAGSGQGRRHHLHETVVHRAASDAVWVSGISQRASCHTLRHCFATHLLEDGTDTRTLQELLKHAEVSITTIYPHVLNRAPLGVRSPLDHLPNLLRKPSRPVYPGVSIAGEVTRGDEGNELSRRFAAARLSRAVLAMRGGETGCESRADRRRDSISPGGIIQVSLTNERMTKPTGRT